MRERLNVTITNITPNQYIEICNSITMPPIGTKVHLYGDIEAINLTDTKANGFLSEFVGSLLITSLGSVSIMSFAKFLLKLLVRKKDSKSTIIKDSTINQINNVTFNHINITINGYPLPQDIDVIQKAIAKVLTEK